ncbi:hypothetical protein N0V90_002657 [Kalmusia sp. IMI 367209]|nr:hypothetical protein N0V90_002657 [Kalmusia sp. IMI 367209]
MSVPAVQARSLSTLTSLASNPPSYPRNPTHVKHEPLVLYIARVPGSRDVFLSPMKPREKVVTAEDIQNSLYFVHVEQPEDVHLVDQSLFKEPQYSNSRPDSSHGPPPAAVQRKPVSNPPYPVSNPPYPVSNDPPYPVSPVQPPPRRKPIPGTLAPVNGFENAQNRAANLQPTSTGLLGPDFVPRRSQDENRPPLPQRPSQQTMAPGTYLTLIRRDPASGAQWNVARIEDPPVPDISSSTFNEPARRKAGAPLYIEVTNPGYSKFLHSEPSAMPPLPSRDSNTTNATYSSAQDVPATALNTNQARAERDDGVFRRRLWMEGAKYPGGEFGHRRLKSHDSNMSGSSPRNSFEGVQRDRLSMDSRPSGPPPFLTRENQSYSSIQASEKQTTFRGYVFTSPWNGRCEFITGAGGGSLKCRHLIPGLQGAPPAAMPVSELRFNLPSSSKASTPRAEESSKRSSFFHRPRHGRHNSSYTDTCNDSTDDVRRSLDRMDLSLGQEFAGGGFGGKQAKLGKLIIEDEGLKMVDLLVAANLALWWRAYEK